MKQEYAFFYVLGREEKPIKNDIDTESIARDVLAGKGTTLELTRAAVEKAAESLRVGIKKRHFLEEHDDAIKDAGGDGEEAYSHYLDGRIDNTTFELEDEVFEEIASEFEDEDDDEEEESDDEDDDEDKD